jgi:predicted permease
LTFGKDIQFALRGMLQQPGYTAVAALSLGLGIGANAAIFTLINAVFLHPLPVAAMPSLVRIFMLDSHNPGYLGISNPNFHDYRQNNTVLADAAGSFPVAMGLSTDRQPEQIPGELVSGNYFDLLGVKPVLGRTFTPEEDGAPGAHPVIVLSHAFWARQYGANPGILGESVKLNGHQFTVIGVGPPNFAGLDALGTTAIWAPLATYAQLSPLVEYFNSRRFGLLGVVGRLKPGVSLPAAQAQLQAIAIHLQKEYPVDNRDRTVVILPLANSLIDPNGRNNIVSVGQLLITVVALVLLIACANVANLQLVRSAGRRKEIAIRLSMGASRFRLIRQLLTESLALALLGGAVGFVFAAWGRNLLWSFRPPFLEHSDLDLSLDGRVLMFTLCISLVTGLLFGLAPALQSASPDLVTELKERTAQAAHGSGFLNARNLLVVAQVALSLIALIGAGLFLRSMQNAQRADLGFAAQKIGVFEINPGLQGYTPERAQIFYRQMMDRLRSTPGVLAVSMANTIPLGFDGLLRSIFIEGQEPAPGNRGVLVLTNNIEPRYFQTMQIPLLQGRPFNDSDRAGSAPVAIVNETMANRFWPNRDALGKRFRFFGDQAPVQIVGVAKDNKYFNISEAPRACAFVPVSQKYVSRMTVAFRGDGDPASLLGTVRREAQSLDPDLIITNAYAMPELIDRSLWASRMGAGLLAVFGFLALVLSSIGVYGVMAYSVAQRTSELGIRMALGARPADVFQLVLRHGVALLSGGLALGLAGAFALSRFIARLLYGVGASDPGTFGVTALILSAVALIAILIPARRATAIDPLVALRSE